MRLNIPETIGEDLRLLPEGTARAILEKLIYGKSKAKKPKLTARYTITDEMESNPEGAESTIGAVVLETFSLQSHALFAINNVYKAVTGEKLPQGDIEVEDFVQLMQETLEGTEWDLELENSVPDDGSSTEERTSVADKQYIG